MILRSSVLAQIRLFLFDFDGVFTSGKMGENFNERDSMGTNMLRLGYYFLSNKIPEVAIVTGENNEMAKEFAKREHFNYVFLGIRDKKIILNFLREGKAINPSEILLVYDDINDLSLIDKVGLRFLINQPGSLIFQRLVKKQKGYDFLTKHYGGQGAVREICELILDTLKIFPQCVEHRTNFSNTYQRYWELRNSLITLRYVQKGGELQLTK